VRTDGVERGAAILRSAAALFMGVCGARDENGIHWNGAAEIGNAASI
jgi:hypothetical protein